MRFKDEAALNKWLRRMLRARGYFCIHVKEADVPGPLDLVVTSQVSGISSWVELKIDDEKVRPSQIEFARTLWQHGIPAHLVRYWNDTEIFQVGRFNSQGVAKLVNTPVAELISWIT